MNHYSFQNISMKYLLWLLWHVLHSMIKLLTQNNQMAQVDHSDRRNGALYDLERLNSCRKRWQTRNVFHCFYAVIRHPRLRNVFHRNGKRRRFMPFPPRNGKSYWNRFIPETRRFFMFTATFSCFYSSVWYTTT
jgi:hypothetical protein